MEITTWYRYNREQGLAGRYITLEHIWPILNRYKMRYDIFTIGQSELGSEIPIIKVGDGKEKILAWSQMHGNESTTTKALFDFLKFLSQEEYLKNDIDLFLNTYTFYIIPILNPDGSELYTRENINKVDLNRDAQALTQKESQCLRNIFDIIKPDLCLNMHDQRSIYGFSTGKPAVVSFLSPAADENRTVTEARKIAMQKIVKMSIVLQKHLPKQVGRYDDSFNEACVGDTFQKMGVPTILFEAGHYQQDYQREKTREFIFYALLSLFDIIDEQNKNINYKDYFEIPENLKNYNDFILRNVKIDLEKDAVDVAIHYKEVLKDNDISFTPIIDEIGDLSYRIGHAEREVDFMETLTIPQNNLTIGVEISKIYAKSDDSLIFFQEFISFIS